ncbi:host cell factor 1-like isoform X2 [Diabrotica undecimpunctata]|uniref:host cell factor 1-like isoform X2 n=1 Tax=Diabrotica undecimpunctata TaxID=50387 RepID=UPI003B631EFF
MYMFEATKYMGKDVWGFINIKGYFPRCAYLECVVHDEKIICFGGKSNDGIYTDVLYELQTQIWECTLLAPTKPTNGESPCPRSGHSFTLINSKVYLFGGVTNDSGYLKNPPPKYLNDLYTLDITSKPYRWEIPKTYGPTPCPRESHTSAAYTDKQQNRSLLIIYGGTNGSILGDVWFLDTNTMTWCQPKIAGIQPLPRFLHTSTVIGHKMFIFGGFVQTIAQELFSGEISKEVESSKECTNILKCLNLGTMSWDELNVQQETEHDLPCARSSHTAVAIGSRLHIWSGRDGTVKEGEIQVLCKDLWYLDVDRPPAPGLIELVKAEMHSIKVKWTGALSADTYLLQVQKLPPPAATITSASRTALIPVQTNINTKDKPVSKPVVVPIRRVGTTNVSTPPVQKLPPPAATITSASTALVPVQTNINTKDKPVSKPVVVPIRRVGTTNVSTPPVQKLPPPAATITSASTALVPVQTNINTKDKPVSKPVVVPIRRVGTTNVSTPPVKKLPPPAATITSASRAALVPSPKMNIPGQTNINTKDKPVSKPVVVPIRRVGTTVSNTTIQKFKYLPATETKGLATREVVVPTAKTNVPVETNINTKDKPVKKPAAVRICSVGTTNVSTPLIQKFKYLPATETKGLATRAVVVPTPKTNVPVEYNINTQDIPVRKPVAVRFRSVGTTVSNTAIQKLPPPAATITSASRAALVPSSKINITAKTNINTKDKPVKKPVTIPIRPVGTANVSDSTVVVKESENVEDLVRGQALNPLLLPHQ